MGTPRPKKYTVLLEWDDGDKHNPDTYQYHVMALDPKEAVTIAQDMWRDERSQVVDLDGPDHWSSPAGCHQDCPACKIENDLAYPICVYKGHLINYLTGEGITK